MAGMAFSNSQICIAHAMGHALGALFKVPHGRSVAVFLPYTIEYNARAAAGRYAEIADALGLGGEDELDKTMRLVRAIRDLMRQVEEPMSVAELGIRRADYEAKLEELVDKARSSTGTVANPRDVGRGEYERLFMYAYEGRSVDF